jgi:hypothetical protein
MLEEQLYQSANLHGLYLSGGCYSQYHYKNNHFLAYSAMVYLHHVAYVNDELDRIWKVVAVTHLRFLPLTVPEEAEKSHEKLQSG